MRRGGKMVCIDGYPDRTHLLATWAEPDKCPYVVPHLRPIVTEFDLVHHTPQSGCGIALATRAALVWGLDSLQLLRL